MIYEIDSVELPIALQNGCSIVIISADSSKALITGTNLQGLNLINQYTAEQLNSILSDAFWKQPCVNCEVV